jgi:hypothetical protein
MNVVNQYSLFIFSFIALLGFAVAFGYLFTENNLQNIFTYILFFVIPIALLISFFLNWFSNGAELSTDKFVIIILICLVGFPSWLNGIYDLLASSYYTLSSIPVAGDFLNSVMGAITGTNNFNQNYYNQYKAIYQNANIYYFVDNKITDLKATTYDNYRNSMIDIIYYMFNLVYFIFLVSCILMVVGND